MSGELRHPLTDDERRLVEENMGLIGRTIDLYFASFFRGEDFDEAWQDGTFGLIQAVRKFDPDRGLKFSTMALPWIRSSIQKGYANRGENSEVRQIIRAGKIPPRPLSLDADAFEDGDGVTLADQIADTSCDAPESVIDRIDAQRRIGGVIEVIGKDGVSHFSDSQKNVAADLGIHRETLRRRQSILRQELRREGIDEEAA